MAISSAQWSVLVVLAAVAFVYVNDPSSFHNAVVGLLGKAGVAEVPQVQLYYNVTVRDNSDHEQNFLFNHSVEITRIAAAVRDPVSRIELAQEFTTPHIPEMLAAKHWKCAVCKEEAETVLLHPLSNQLGLDPPMLKDFGGVAVCGKLACQHQASEMMHTIFKQVMDASRIEISEDEGIIDVY